MRKTKTKRHQKLYKMKGCSRKKNSRKSRKTRNRKYLGGTGLAYPSNNVPTTPNPFLAYTGKGGSVNLENAYPAKEPPSNGYGWINPQPQKGGLCGTCGVMAGGSCGCSLMKGGSSNSNNGIPYPDGLVGKPWTPAIQGWPGVSNTTGDSNYYPVNDYKNDISRQMQNIGANPPFNGMKGGKKSRRNQKGGNLSNFLGQDLINLGRQFQFGVGSAYNALAGYPSPVSPLPWKDQLSNTPSLATIKALK